MKLTGLIFVAALSAPFASSASAGETKPLDYTQRNAALTPAGTTAPEAKAPERNDVLQEKRVEYPTVDKKPAAVGDRRAGIDVSETHEKQIRDRNSHRPEAAEQPLSSQNHREAADRLQATNQISQPPLVSKYQNSLTSASSSNMSRFPATTRDTKTKFNRFVFRKNTPDLEAAAVTPAAGGSTVKP